MSVYDTLMEVERRHTNEEVKSMEKLTTQRIYFWGSGEYHERLVFERNDGTFWCRWYGQLVQVENRYNDKWSSSGWRTIESY